MQANVCMSVHFFYVEKCVYGIIEWMMMWNYRSIIAVWSLMTAS